jgi:hypothetical protein
MLGRKADMKTLLTQLQDNNIVNVRTTEFYQGRTTRWGIAWSFSSDGLAEIAVRIILESEIILEIQPFCFTAVR